MAMINEAKREHIAGEARQILAKFSKSLEKVKLKEKKEKKEVGGFREEKQPIKGDADFRKRMFETRRIRMRNV